MEVLDIPVEVAKGVFELKSKISRAEQPEGAAHPLPLEHRRFRAALQPVQFQRFALACVLQKLQQRYPLAGGQWKWSDLEGWVWNTGLEFGDPVFSIEFHNPFEGPFADSATMNYQTRVAILTNPEHPQHAALEELIYNNLKLVRSTDIHEPLEATAQNYLDILTECSTYKPIQGVAERKATAGIAVAKGMPPGMFTKEVTKYLTPTKPGGRRRKTKKVKKTKKHRKTHRRS